MDMEGLSVICAGLGMAEEDDNGNRIDYIKGEYCLDNLKDLLRFLRRDDPQNRHVFNQVCRWNIVLKDLIPIIEHCEDRSLILNAVKVLVFLTMPIDPSSNDIPQQLDYLWGLKSSITSSNIVAVIVSLLESPLESLEGDVFTEDDWKLVQLILTLFRNILSIQEISLRQKASGTASHLLSLRERFLEVLFCENVMDLILIITQHFGGSSGYLRHDNLLLLEIFHYIFLGQEAELIAKVHEASRKVDDDTKDSISSLKFIMEEEEIQRLSRLHNSARHSHSSGTFSRLTVDGSKAVFMGKPAASCDPLLKPHKLGNGPSKRIVWDHGRLPLAKDKLLESLHDFINQFLSGGYNVLMQSIREDIEKEHHTIQKSDVTVFFQVAQFITSFQYHKLSASKPNMGKDASETFLDTHADNTYSGGDICGPIAATLNDLMFQLVIVKWRNAFEGLKETHDYKFVSAAGSLMKIMICMLDLVLELLPEDSKESQTARVLLYKLFYDQTDQGMTQLLFNLLKSFDSHKQPKSDLADLVEMIYKVLQLVEKLQGRGTLRVSRKLRKGKKKKALICKGTEDQLLGQRSTCENEISISSLERVAEMGEANDAILHTSSDGKQGISHAEYEKSAVEIDGTDGNMAQMDCMKSSYSNGDDLNGTDDSSEDEEITVTDEVDFKLSTLVSALANNNIIQNLCWLLKFYKSNSSSTNHYIISVLRRITDDLELSPMLYQLSLLTTFYNILAEQKSFPCQDYSEIVDFLSNVIRKMMKKMKNQPLLFVEVLFWKTRKECHYINAEYLLHELGHLKKESRNWENNLGSQDIDSSQAQGSKPINIADALGEDEADVVISHELRNERVQGASASSSDNELDKQQNKYNPGKSVESEGFARKKRGLFLGSELNEKIRDLYEKFKYDLHCSRLIAEDLDPDGKVSAAQVSNKLKKLGLKSAQRKRMHHCGKPTSTRTQLGEEGRVLETIGDLQNSTVLEESLSNQPMKKRKRVCAVSEDEEATIRSLYEQFKDHKRCSYMIANALGEENKFTASQISRNLKKLGLRIPQRKRGDDLMDSFEGKMQDSDDETLVSLMNRGKTVDNSRWPIEGADEQTAGGNLSDDSDEILSSVLKKTRRSHSKENKVKPKTIMIEGTKNDRGMGNAAEVDTEERDVGEESLVSKPAGTSEGFPFNPAATIDTKEAEVIVTSNAMSIDSVFHELYQRVEDELADSGDEMDYSASSRSVLDRRKLRMVFDNEDDE